IKGISAHTCFVQFRHQPVKDLRDDKRPVRITERGAQRDAHKLRGVAATEKTEPILQTLDKIHLLNNNGLLHMSFEPLNYPSVSVIAFKRHAVIVISIDDQLISPPALLHLLC